MSNFLSRRGNAQVLDEEESGKPPEK